MVYNNADVKECDDCDTKSPDVVDHTVWTTTGDHERVPLCPVCVRKMQRGENEIRAVT